MFSLHRSISLSAFSFITISNNIHVKLIRILDLDVIISVEKKLLLQARIILKLVLSCKTLNINMSRSLRTWTMDGKHEMNSRGILAGNKVSDDNSNATTRPWLVITRPIVGVLRIEFQMVTARLQLKLRHRIIISTSLFLFFSPFFHFTTQSTCV